MKSRRVDYYVGILSRCHEGISGFNRKMPAVFKQYVVLYNKIKLINIYLRRGLPCSGRSFDVSSIKDLLIEKWVFLFYAKGIRWNGFY